MNIQFMRFRKVALMISGALLITTVISLTFKNHKNIRRDRK